jgi:ribosomal protein S18 acetylase RimI-like enzyme
MESANLWSQIAGNHNIEVRMAEQSDAESITRLLRNAPFTHIHADWHYPVDWLSKKSFVIIEKPNFPDNKKQFSNRIFKPQSSLQACLAVAADPPPAAWVRLAAVSNKAIGRKMMAAMFAAITSALQEENLNQVAWLLVEDWPEIWLPDLGFEHINDVITYSKLGTNFPQIERSTNLDIRPAKTADLAALAEIEAIAFEPLWRHSELSLSLAKQQALSFDVGWLDNTPVAFQFSSSTLRGAHLSRITVDPAVQHRGIGSALLIHALEGYARMGISDVTLNTQLDNLTSQHFYQKFGFQQTGERFPVWSAQLSPL